MAPLTEPADLSEHVRKRSQELFEEHRQAIYWRTDRLFAAFMPCQWVGGIGMALWATRYTWSGRYYQTHLHVWLAEMLGAVITALPVFLALCHPGEKITRYTIATAQMLMSALLIHVSGGRLETHFHIFGSLAILAFYRDWKVFLPATAVVALDHIVRGIYWPESVLGVSSVESWRWMEHAAWVVFENAFLIRSCFQSISEMQDIARQTAELEAGNDIVECRVQERTLQLEEEMAERKLLEAQLTQAHKLELIGQLAAGVAHEINTPVQYVGDNTRFVGESFGSIAGLIGRYREFHETVAGRGMFLEELSELRENEQTVEVDYLLGEVPRAVTQSAEGLERVAGIVRAMREFSHPGTSEQRSVDLNTAIENTVTVCRNEWKYVAGMTLDFDRELPPVRCLGGEINQVVLNLIVNAAHAIADAKRAEGTGMIRISTRRDGDWVEIRIGDNGTGMPAATIQRIFTPFFTTKEVGRGTGQGLYLARTVVVRKHGGTIHFETRENEGTTFIIRLPIGGESVMRESADAECVPEAA